MRRKNFVGSSKDILAAIIHEEWDRKNNGHVAIVETAEDQPIPCMFNAKHYVPLDEVPESVEDIEESLIEAIDTKETPPETFESMGTPPSLECPRHFKIVKRFIESCTSSKPAAVASINARTGVIALSF